MDYLFPYQSELQYAQIQKVREERMQKRLSLEKKLQVSTYLEQICVSQLRFQQGTLVIGAPQDIPAEILTRLREDVQRLRPWRKGPFLLFGETIDSEWRSDWKWERLAPAIQDLTGKVVADVGCNNGYYMFRMVPYQPRLVIGFDPTIHYFDQFHFIQKFTAQSHLHFELLGIEHLEYFPHFFDTIFCLGVIYHHPDPIRMLRGLFVALKKGGELFLESQGIPGEESVALFPRERYAKVPNTWFVPTASCLINWLWRSGFESVELLGTYPLTTEEQRSTADAPSQSLKDFLDEQDHSKTVEGYPAPIRIYIKALKP